jgi:hypothetical protein
MSDTIGTTHSARLHYVHGEDCEGCQDLALYMALHVVSLAGWRIVKTEARGDGLIYVDSRDEVVEISEEWKS